MRNHRVEIAFVLALLLAACGGDAMSSPGADDSQTSSSEPAAELAGSSDETSSTVDSSSPAAFQEGVPTSESYDESPSKPSSTTTTTASVAAEPVPTTTPRPAIQGEVPDELMQRILADASERPGVDPSALRVLRSEAVVWNDGSLGCPEPGVLYTQQIIDGYWVELVADAAVLDYRLNSSGSFVLCEGKSPRP